jgi:hypothetical protein
MFLAYLIGVSTTILTVFVTIRMSNFSAPRVLIAAATNNFNTFTESYIIGNTVACGVITLIMFVLLFSIPLYECKNLIFLYFYFLPDFLFFFLKVIYFKALD